MLAKYGEVYVCMCVCGGGGCCDTPLHLGMPTVEIGLMSPMPKKTDLFVLHFHLLCLLFQCSHLIKVMPYL